MCILLVFGFWFDVLRGTKALDFGVKVRGGESKQSKGEKANQSRDRKRE